MIYGVGTDIAKVSRFEKWIKNPKIFLRFFNEKEQYPRDLQKNVYPCTCHYASRFAAKEAFVKALGTGFAGITLNDFYLAKNEEGKPYFKFGKDTKAILDKRLGQKYNIQVSISHEKEYAVAFVIIEILS
ncbi:holo-ACP synthase [Treponema pectinovorum]|uniref:holo-ACP synthase n=1 Tax=Treponema pectinovorum TaxID=164 RepID=UPI0011C8E1A2|nr:holo-ACP synthase [Treponema pectinovorum]